MITDIEARRLDIVVVNKQQEKSCLIIDIAIPWDVRVHEKEAEKIEKYQKVKREIKRLWKLRKVQIVLVVVGAPGSLTKRLAIGELVKKTGNHITNRIFPKNRIVRNSQNPEKGV